MTKSDFTLARPLSPSLAAKIPHQSKPEWLRIQPPKGEAYLQMKAMFRGRQLHTVCEEAHCPNVAECWSAGTATLLIGGDYCTRACRFCAVKTMRVPPPLDPKEPEKIAQSIAHLGLRYVVLTGVDRDDLPDGGSEHFAKTILAIQSLKAGVIIEALVSDFRGQEQAIETIVRSGLEVYAHNVETVARLQYRVRDPRASYEQSLKALRFAKHCAQHALFTKSSIMLGLGETEEELLEAFADLREHGVDFLTLGQYLRPSLEHLPVERYYSPDEFKKLAEQAESYGFLNVVAGPLVRSSYRAGEYFIEKMVHENRTEKRSEVHGV